MQSRPALRLASRNGKVLPKPKETEIPTKSVVTLSKGEQLRLYDVVRTGGARGFRLKPA